MYSTAQNPGLIEGIQNEVKKVGGISITILQAELRPNTS